jgi:hypothetical protein
MNSMATPTNLIPTDLNGTLDRKRGIGTGTPMEMGFMELYQMAHLATGRQ